MAFTGIGGFFGGRDYNGPSIQDDLWGIQRQVIEEIAERESCEIVGRCADYILRDKADLLTVFIHASYDKRAERIVKVYGERDETPAQRFKDEDYEPEYMEKAKRYLYGEILVRYEIEFDDVERFVCESVDRHMNDF